MTWTLCALRRTCCALTLFLLLASLSGISPVRAGDDRWTSTGGPPGLVYALALDPQNAGVMYAGTGSGGLFKSTNGGQDWVASSQGLPSKAVFALAIDPTHPATVYAGTNKGVYRSDDAAATWLPATSAIPLDSSGSSYIYALSVDPRQPATLYAGTLLGVFKSQNRGQTWQEKNAGTISGGRPSVQSIVIDPQSSNVLYASAEYAGQNTNLFKSQDAGETWAPLTVGLVNAPVSSIAIDPGDSQKVYVGTRGQGVFASADGGISWRQVGKDIIESHVASVAVSGNPATVYAAGMYQSFYRSADSGVTWEGIGGSIGERRPSLLAVDPGQSGVLWLATAGGIYRSSDRGVNWADWSKGVYGAEIVALLPDPASPARVYASAWSGGLYMAGGTGDAPWQALPLGTGLPFNLAVDAADPRRLYASMVYLSPIKETGLYISRDGGQTWQPSADFKGKRIMAIAANAGRVLLGTETGVYISEDAGTTWRQSNTGLPLSKLVGLLDVHPRDTQNVYLMLQTAPSDLYWSNDGGIDWALLHTFETPPNVVVSSPAASGVMYGATNTSVLKSNDGGKSWQKFPSPGSGQVLSLAPHPVVSDTVYLGSSTGAYRSLDGGRTWEAIGLQDQKVTALCIMPANPAQVYAGTADGGIWAFTAVPTLMVEPAGLAFLLEPGAAAPGPKRLVLRDSSGSSFSWTAQASLAAPWLAVSPSTGASVPLSLTISANTGTLPPGSYQSVITITSSLTSTRNSPLQVPVYLYYGPLKRFFFPLIGGLSSW